MAKTPAPSIADLPDDAFVRIGQIVPDLIPVSAATWRRMVADGRAPEPVRTSPQVVVWHVGKLRQWLRQTTG
jgi:predicted DNA-binding transcriptional regulator AlpA